MFALRQGEVSNLEVGPDFMAFDTEFIRYPERGEAYYPGPWADRFRATVPFAQLYQLCRQVLTPAEQTTDEVDYEADMVIGLTHAGLLSVKLPFYADTEHLHRLPAGHA